MVTSRSFHALARWVIGICKFQIPSNPSLSTRLIKSRGSTSCPLPERITHDSHSRRPMFKGSLTTTKIMQHKLDPPAFVN